MFESIPLHSTPGEDNVSHVDFLEISHSILAESMRRKARRTYDLANLSKASQGRSEICTDKKVLTYHPDPAPRTPIYLPLRFVQ